MKEFRVETSSRINAFCVTNDDYSVVLKKENEANMVCNMINQMLKGLDVIDKRFYVKCDEVNSWSVWERDKEVVVFDLPKSDAEVICNKLNELSKELEDMKI